jgi:hypothetical protein
LDESKTSFNERQYERLKCALIGFDSLYFGVGIE